MNFYQAMQLDVSVCKGKIRNAANPSERHKLIAALIVKDILCVLFAVVFIYIIKIKFNAQYRYSASCYKNSQPAASFWNFFNLKILCGVERSKAYLSLFLRKGFHANG